MTSARWILLVDDDVDFLDSAARLLEHCGYRVLGAPSGRAAIALLCSEEPPSLILLDLRMPEMSGREVLREKQQIPGGNDVPAIILSGSEARQVDEELARLGVVEWLVKPVETDELLAVVERNLSGRQGQQ